MLSATTPQSRALSWKATSLQVPRGSAAGGLPTSTRPGQLAGGHWGGQDAEDEDERTNWVSPQVKSMPLVHQPRIPVDSNATSRTWMAMQATRSSAEVSRTRDIAREATRLQGQGNHCLLGKPGLTLEEVPGGCEATED